MPALLVRHKVASYATWRAQFENDDETRRANGSLGARLFRNAADPDELIVLIEWDDLDRARLFVRSDDLREAMTRGGVVGRPDVWFLDDADSSSM